MQNPFLKIEQKGVLPNSLYDYCPDWKKNKEREKRKTKAIGKRENPSQYYSRT